MPTYNFKNKKTGDQWQEMMSNSEREKLLNDNPDIIQLLINPVSLGDPVTSKDLDQLAVHGFAAQIHQTRVVADVGMRDENALGRLPIV